MRRFPPSLGARSLRALALGLAAAAPLASGHSVVAQTSRESVRDPAAKRLQVAAGFLHRGLNDLARDEYGRFLAEHPQHAEAGTAHYGLAVALVRLGEPKEAIASLDRALASPSSPFAPDALLLRGRCAAALGDDRGAVRDFERLRADFAGGAQATAAALDEAEAHLRLGDLAAARRCAQPIAGGPAGGARDRAEAVLALASLRDPGADRAAIAAAVARLETLGTRDAEASFGTLLAEAEGLRRLGDPRAAERFAEAAARAAAAGERSAANAGWLGAATALRVAGRPADALAALDRLSAEAAAGSDALLERGLILHALGRHADAIAALDRVAGATDDPRADDAAYWAAIAASEDGDARAAVRRLADALRRWPRSELRPWMLADQAMGLVGLGDVPAAETLTAELRDLQPEHPRLPSLELAAAEAAFAAADHAVAAERYAGFLLAHPQHPLRSSVEVRHGIALLRSGQSDAGIAALQAALAERGGANAAPPIDPPLRIAAAAALGDALIARSAWADAAKVFAALAEDSMASPELRADAHLKAGVAAARSGDAATALLAFDAVLAASPSAALAAHAAFERGQALVALAQPEEADRAFAAAAEDERFRTAALRQRATLAAAAGRPADAAALLGELKDADSALERGRSLLAAEAWADAAEAFEACLAAGAAQAIRDQAAAGRSIAWSRLGRAADAERAFVALRGAELPAGLRETVTVEEAWCLRRLGRDAEAIALWSAAAERDPRSRLGRIASLELAERSLAAGRLDEAAARLAAAGDVDELRAAYLGGLLAVRQGRPSDGIGRLVPFRDRWQASPYAPSARLALGEALLAAGPARIEEAIAELRFVADQSTDDATAEVALLRLGDATATAERWSESEAAFERHLRRFPRSEFRHQSRFGIGWARERDGRLDQAVDAYRAITADHDGPIAARAQFQIGECRFAQGRLDEAVREFLTVELTYAVDEWSAAALFEAGRCFAALGRADDAARQWAAVEQRFPDGRWATLAAAELTRLEAERRAHPAERDGARGTASAPDTHGRRSTADPHATDAGRSES